MNPNSIDIQAKQKAEKTLRANLTPRYFKLDRLGRYVEGTQYDGRPSFWNDDVPYMERAPCIVKPAAETAIRSNVDFVLGEHRWPTITSRPGEDDSAFDERLGLSEEDSETVDALLAKIVKQARLKPAFSELLAAAQGCGTAVAIGAVKNGRLCVDTTLAKWCTPTFDEVDPSRVAKLEIRYPYVEEFFDDAQGRRSYRCMLYRRVIDGMRDIVYKPAIADEEGKEPLVWTEDAGASKEHGLGFCPVVWYRFEAKCSAVNEIDGNATHARVTDELDALNFAHSQRHRASLYCGDPQVIEIGVDEDHNPAPMGRTFTLWMPGDPPENKQWQGGGMRGAPARKKGPGVVWRYPLREGTEVKYLSLAGDALKNIDDGIKLLESLIKDALSVVYIDPDEMKIGSALSGRALEWLYRKQTNHCDTIRDDAGHGLFLPVIDMLLRIVYVVGQRANETLYLAGVDKAIPILKRFMQEVAGRGEQWFPPAIELQWPPYFRATDADQKAAGENVRADMQAKLITRRTALEKNAPYYNIGDIAAYEEALDEQAEKDAEELHAAQAALQSMALPGEAGEPVEAAPAVKKPAAPRSPVKVGEVPGRPRRRPGLAKAA